MLVRDPIYNMIMSSRRLPKVKKLAPTKYQNALHVKLSKKAFEVGTTCTRHELLTELADVQKKLTHSLRQITRRTKSIKQNTTEDTVLEANSVSSNVCKCVVNCC